MELNATAQIILALLSGLGLLLKGVAAVVTALRQPSSPPEGRHCIAPPKS
ncbi:MAG TPA: hypothetical protein VFP12_00915 [Allosphingosinicella sp.]|nr:hypothetical protein [Allosphingosinicella sp.]